MTYIPKGSMCASCKNKFNDCSKLPFDKMKVIETDGNYSVVKCVEFKNQTA